MTKHLILVGLMGCGKTTLSRMLRRRLEMPIYEIDSMIEDKAGKSIQEIFTTDGEPVFRQLECETITQIVNLPPGIVSTGGGTFINEDNRQTLLKCGWVFYLHGTPEELAKRIQSAATRPLLLGRDKEEVLREHFTSRDPFYRQAHITVATDRRTSHEVAEEIYRIFLGKQKRGKAKKRES